MRKDIALAGALLLGACTAPPPEGSPMNDQTQPVPAFMTQHARPGTPLIVLLTTSEACLSCDGGAISRSMRQIRAAYGTRVDFVVFGVGDDMNPIESFVRTERLDMPVVRLSRADYTATIGQAPLPGVWLVHDGVVRSRFHDSAAERWRAIRGQVEDLGVTLTRILGPGDAPL